MKQAWALFRQNFHLRYSAWLLQGLSRITFWSHKFKQRFSLLGRAVAAMLLLTLVFGANIKISSIYQLFALLLALLVVGLVTVWLRSIFFKPSFKCKRLLPQFATVGVPTHYRISVENTSHKALHQVSVEEVQALPKPSLFQFLNMKEPDEDKRNWYDRHTGYYRFVWLQDWLRRANLNAYIIADLVEEASQDCVMNFTPRRRGLIRFSGLRLRFPEPLGLVYSFQTFQQADGLLVLPKAYRVSRNLELGGERAYQQGMVSQASHVGESEEFSKLREYRDGDTLRHIFWPSLANSNKPLVKEYQDEYVSRAALVLDNFATEDKQLLFEEAVSVAAGLVMQGDSHEALLDKMFVGSDTMSEQQMTSRTMVQTEQMLETLASVQLCQADIKLFVQMVLQQGQALSGFIIILLAWDEKRQNFVSQLRALSIPIRVFLMQAQDELPVQENGVISLRMGNVQHDLDLLS